MVYDQYILASATGVDVAAATLTVLEPLKDMSGKIKQPLNKKENSKLCYSN